MAEANEDDNATKSKEKMSLVNNIEDANKYLTEYKNLDSEAYRIINNLVSQLQSIELNSKEVLVDREEVTNTEDAKFKQITEGLLELNQYEIKFKNKPASDAIHGITVDHKKYAESYIRIAKRFLANGQNKEADNYLSKAERIYPETKSVVMNIRDTMFKISNKLSESNEELSLQSRIHSLENIDKNNDSSGQIFTEGLLPGPEVNFENSSTSYLTDQEDIVRDNRHAAQYCIDIANISESMGKLEKAERFLLKAQRFHPNKNTKQSLINIQTTIATRKINSGNAINTINVTAKCKKVKSKIFDFSASRSVTALNENVTRTGIDLNDRKEESDQCKIITETVLLDEDLIKIKRFLKESRRIIDLSGHPKVQLEKVHVEPEFKNITEIENRTKQKDNCIYEVNPNSGNIDLGNNKSPSVESYALTEEEKEEAYKCITVAEKAYFNSDFEKAERFLIKAERFCPTLNVDRLLNYVRKSTSKKDYEQSSEISPNQMSSRLYPDSRKVSLNDRPKYMTSESHSPEVNYNSMKNKAIKCVTDAKSAISEKEFKKPKKHVQRAESLYPNNQTKKLLREMKKHFKSEADDNNSDANVPLNRTVASGHHSYNYNKQQSHKLVSRRPKFKIFFKNKKE